jgi:hypothetical protein
MTRIACRCDFRESVRWALGPLMEMKVPQPVIPSAARNLLLGRRKSRLKAWFVLVSLPLASCSRAPSFDILGSFFPAWLVCLTVAILLTFLARWLLLRLHIAVVVPILVYPSLTFLFAFALWLIFFR